VETFVSHAGTYDPVKAHEYYLRTRKLKGRNTGSVDNTSTPNGKAPNVSTPPKPSAPQPTVESVTKERTEKLRARLEKLKELLASLVKEAKDRSGVDQPAKADDTAKDKAKDTTSAEEDKTAKQKREAAKAAKEYYEKNKDVATLQQEIADVKAKIKDAREKITAAVAKAREEAAAKMANEVNQTPIPPKFETGGLRN